ncbi:hypothetical protein GGH19_001774 [Coemansia sp. RSA 1807]|nr:hypothetical protein LPJ58_002053 [Coemansia sp. RSA 1591]KAJ1764192.1 hypothetical protein LPJ69_001993 [Coemansia sp. RSA 1752]KAJ1791020.1 hypothetical protein LPJ67_001974 [Coemansia sp. RSA 1938]KAJ2128795.1 hypothetical protein GGH17_004293 [Coemansia sp. RSA 788]KAJ2184821.1 hypothetical protein GGH18_004559 [Coemansia sp. RSA 530]KAJ2206534.1 hypothetical protein IW143_005086 [Coemansia sp. RSA 520]KAJ2264478.1 hypothetical protein J3F81_006210 [Coemansia sp. RSA 371]KAJ2422137.1 
MTTPKPIHSDTIAAGLQRQLDELREIIHRGGDGSAQQSRQSKQENDSIQNLQAEIEKQRVRIVHLLRALDSKDRVIDQLRTDTNQVVKD